MSDNSFEIQNFIPYLNEKFYIGGESSHPIKAELIEATEIGSSSSSNHETSRRKPFSLIFRLEMDTAIPQQIYKIEHTKMGTFELFLVPIGPDKKGMCYEAVFA